MRMRSVSKEMLLILASLPPLPLLPFRPRARAGARARTRVGEPLHALPPRRLACPRIPRRTGAAPGQISALGHAQYASLERLRALCVLYVWSRDVLTGRPPAGTPPRGQGGGCAALRPLQQGPVVHGLTPQQVIPWVRSARVRAHVDRA